MRKRVYDVAGTIGKNTKVGFPLRPIVYQIMMAG